MGLYCGQCPFAGDRTNWSECSFLEALFKGSLPGCSILRRVPCVYFLDVYGIFYCENDIYGNGRNGITVLLGMRALWFV